MNKLLLTLAAATAISGSANAAGFVNGSFEAGDASGWEQGGIYRAGYNNNQLNPSLFTIGSDTGRSSIIDTSYVDPNVNAALLGNTVYSGNNSYRVENTVSGGYASLLQQRVNNYTDANIFFAWKSVLDSEHGTNDAATMIIELKDLTLGTTLIRRVYNAANNGSGVDGRFDQDSNGYFYTPDWQIEQLATGSSLGNDLLLSIIAADCSPTAHFGYVYLDGFGAVTPPPVDPGAVPEPATWAMLITGFGLVGGSMRYGRRKTSVSFA